MAVLDDEIKERFTADLLRHGESFRLVDPHQRRVDRDSLVKAESEDYLHGFDGIVAAVRVTGIVSFTHARYQMAGAAPVGQRAGKAEKNKITAGHEGGWQTAPGHLDGSFASERGVGEVARRPRRNSRAGIVLLGYWRSAVGGCGGDRRTWSAESNAISEGPGDLNLVNVFAVGCI